jgi:MFS family permease
MFGMFFLGALYLQRVLGYNPLEVGLAFLPSTLVMGTMSLKVSDRLAMRFGPKRVLMPSMAAIAGGLALFAIAPVDATYVTDVMPATLLIGLGAGLGFPALMTLAMSGATMEDAGLASGLVNTSMQVGGAIGLAVLATFSDKRTEHLLGEGVSNASALTSGYHLAFVIGLGLVVLAAGIAAVVLRNELPAMMTGEAGDAEDAVPAGEPAYSEAA